MTHSETIDPQTPPAVPCPASSARPTFISFNLDAALAQCLRERLVEKGWTQRRLAKELGMTQGAVSYLVWNKRRADGFSYYERLATKVFDIPLSELCRELEVRVDASRTRPTWPHKAVAAAVAARNALVHGRRPGPTQSPGEPDAPRRAAVPPPVADPHAQLLAVSQQVQEHLGVLRRYYEHLITLVDPATKGRPLPAGESAALPLFGELAAGDRQAPADPGPRPRRRRRRAGRRPAVSR